MSNTTNLSLFKHDNPSTNTNTFDIERALNENWDKIDEDIGKKIYYYDNVQEMKNDENLKEGMVCQTLGYYEENDGGEGLYKIVNDNTLVDDGGSVHVLENGLKAKLIILDNKITPQQFGAYGDGVIDDVESIQNCIDYAKNNNISKIICPKKYFAISKEIYLPINLFVENMFLQPTPNASLLNDYLLFINTSDGTTWTQQYPQPLTFLKNIHLRNIVNNSLILSNCNGIFNLANIIINDIFTYGLNISFKTSDSYYLDVVKINNIDVTYKKHHDFAFQFGFLGDACSIETAHIHDTLTESTSNFIECGNAHYPVSISKVINGNIRANNSMINISNSHIGAETITSSNSDITIENVSFRHVVGPNISLNNSKATLKNISFKYDLNNITYENISDVDVQIEGNTSLVKIENCYKDLLISGSAESHNHSIAKTNIKTNTPFTKTIYSANTLMNYQEQAIIQQDYTSHVGNPQKTSTLAKWKLDSGTFYYKIHLILDDIRKIGVGPVQSTNIEMTSNEGGFMYATATPFCNYRIYRGSESTSFNKYVTVPLMDNKIADNGFSVNGYSWNDRDAGEIDSYNESTFYKILNKTNILCKLNTLPQYGSWTKGDIVIANNIRTNSTYAWICTESGTPGVWKVLSSIPE